MDRLRERDAGSVAMQIVPPFDFRDTRRDAAKKKCGSRVATNAKGTAAIAGCLSKDADLHADLAMTPEPRLFAVDKGALPPWAQPWAKDLRPGLRAVSTFVHGETGAYELVLLVGDDGVRGLWQNVTVEPK